MNNYKNMYEAFGITEKDRDKFKQLEQSEYSKDLRVARVEIITHITNESGQTTKNKEVLDAKLV